MFSRHDSRLLVLAPALVLVLAAAGPATAEDINVFTEGPRQLKVYKVPNVPKAAEPYYGSDNTTLIAQVQDPEAVRAKDGASGGALTWTFTDKGEDLRRINPTGQDACSYFFPDMKHVVFTSIRDNLDLPIGNWSDPRDYPVGSELYIADIDGRN
ncbi:MAG: hypothetical protein OEW72_09195, partial [Gammaproteobacteria bacterium]|nr:hypothetical protein [Gammaproteobacteria bacterium]